MKKKTLRDLSLADYPTDPSFPVVTYQAEIKWVDGVPTLANAPVRISANPVEALTDLVVKALDLPYSGRDPALQGLSCGEAMAINAARQAAEGDHDARNMILDRVIGRPKQKTETVTVTGTLNDFLDHVAREEKITTVDVTFTETTVEDQVEDL